MNLIFEESDIEDAIPLLPEGLESTSVKFEGGRVTMVFNPWDESLVGEFENVLTRKHVSFEKE